MSDDAPKPAIELFHAIGDEGSAAARRVFTELHLGRKVRLRNVYYDNVQADLVAHGGGATPAVWDGERLVEGEDAVVAYLRSL